MSYCRAYEAGMYIYPDGEGIEFMIMPEEIGETYIKNEHMNILLYLMQKRKGEIKERIRKGKEIYKNYEKKEK